MHIDRTSSRYSARLRSFSVVLALLLPLACGGNGDGTPTSPTPNPPPSSGGGGDVPTITISASGVSPATVEIPVGGRVRFVNNGTSAHDMNSDPHPEHTDCPAMNQVGFIQPNETRETGTFNSARTCGFHDHNQPSNASLQGRIVVR